MSNTAQTRISIGGSVKVVSDSSIFSGWVGTAVRFSGYPAGWWVEFPARTGAVFFFDGDLVLVAAGESETCS